ncbi:hypothetical protein B296_00015938 [Ensete ventricosum]|uniref:Serine aminopeptidase S33 domain-containing protein n=1 Tax=Ensete ventricosum TaxID=4639 RepID=A0A427B5Z4_ENSVE|nr:hypothetical protein B296_00015938 [Ensete ventricosum]
MAYVLDSDTGTRLAKAGYAVHGIDYQGHGKSSGLQGYIPSFKNLVEDCSDHFTSVCERSENKKKARYLLGESMGGAVVLLLHRREPPYWNGAVLIAPMCKIRSNPYCYKGRPRLGTAHEVLMVSLDIEKSLNQVINLSFRQHGSRPCSICMQRLMREVCFCLQVSLPFLVVHGGDDIVTDPSVSRLLYETASSEDKTLKLYPGMWHALTSGEPSANIDLVFADIVGWLDRRTAAEGSTSEMEQKSKHDEQQLFFDAQAKQFPIVSL